MTAGDAKLKVVVNTFLAGKIEFGKKLKKSLVKNFFLKEKHWKGDTSCKLLI